MAFDTGLQYDFKDSKEDRHSTRLVAKSRAHEKKAQADASARLYRAYRGKESTKSWKKDRQIRSDVLEQRAQKARKRRVALGLEGGSKKVRKDRRGGINLRAAVRTFQRVGRLPNCDVHLVQSANRDGVDADAYARMIKLMLLRAGIEPNPGPICPDCGADIDAANYKLHREKAKCSRSSGSTSSSTQVESRSGASASYGAGGGLGPTKRHPPKVIYRRVQKAGRSGGRDRALNDAVSVMQDMLAGQRIAEHEKKDEKRETRVEPDKTVRLQGALPRPRDVFYRVGEFASDLIGTPKRSYVPHLCCTLIAACVLLLVIVRLVTLANVGMSWQFTMRLFEWLSGINAIIVMVVVGCLYRLTDEPQSIDVVDANGYYTDLTPLEIELRGGKDGKYHWKGRFVSYSNWRQTQGLLNFASPDRLDSKVMCAPNLWTVTRREVYPLNGRLVDRSVSLHVSGTLIQSMAAERFGMLRGKTYDEGRRILQLYADTQNHTQIDLAWNLVGEPTSLAENTVEYLCALRMCEAGDSTRLKGVEARCFQ